MSVIRPARPEEIADLAAIGLASWRRGIAPLVADAVAIRVAADNPFLPFLRGLGSRVLVAEWQGRPAGLGACEGAADRISDVWVAPDAEGHGLGAALVAALERQIRARGFAEARLEVAAANARAHALYHRLGYVDDWRRPVFDPLLATTLDKVGLRKRL